MRREQTIATLAAHFQEAGSFSPFCYAIGLESPLVELEDSMQEYPLAQPVDEGQLRSFIRSLTFFHEAKHVCQFASTAYGLRTLRYTLSLLAGLAEQPGWQLPIAQGLHNRLLETGTLSQADLRAYDACVMFLDGMDQLRLHHHQTPVSGTNQGLVHVEYMPWSPHFFVLPDQSDQGRAEYAAHLRSIGAHVRSLPRLELAAEGRFERVVINVAVLMECAAVLTEVSHIWNALHWPVDDCLRLVPQGREYLVLIDYALHTKVCTPEALVLTLLIVIDAALMYDPNVLYNVPWDIPDAEGRTDRYPGQTFIELCDAARRLTPLRSYERAEVMRFYGELCESAGLPTPEWMTQAARERAQFLLARAPEGEQALMGRALRAHHDALAYRSEYGAAEWPVFLPTTEGLYETTRRILPALSFYNQQTGQPDRFDPANADTLTVHSILRQAAAGASIDCPLKLGRPFSCPSAGASSQSLCVWEYGGRRHECQLDLLERQLKLRPAKE
jgi:hypothetical protein